MENMDSILGSWMWQLNCQWVSHLHLEDRHSDICPLAKDWLFYLATLHFPMSVWLKPCSSSPIRKTTHHSLSHTHYACGGLRPLPFWDGKERTFRMSHFWYWSSTSFLQQTSKLTCHVSFRASYLLLAFLQTCTKIETQTWPPCDIGNSVTMIHSVQFLAERKRDIWLTDKTSEWTTFERTTLQGQSLTNRRSIPSTGARHSLPPIDHPGFCASNPRYPTGSTSWDCRYPVSHQQHSIQNSSKLSARN